MEKQFNEAANKGGVYRMRNKINGKIYIGSTSRFKKRCYEHERSLRNNKHANKRLQYSFNKYGENAFVFEIIEVIEGGSIRKRRTIEEKYINEIFGQEICYNIHKKTIKKQGPWSNTPEKTRKKISKIHKGNKHALGYKHSKESKQKMSVAAKNMTLEHRKKLSEAHKGKVLIRKKIGTEKSIWRTAQPYKRYKHTEETKKRMSESHKGKKRGTYKIT